jgi:hypothetical protein
MNNNRKLALKFIFLLSIFIFTILIVIGLVFSNYCIIPMSISIIIISLLNMYRLSKK